MRVHALPADYGDALLIEYDSPTTKWVLIDGGTSDSYATMLDRMKELMGSDRRLELLVITHVDQDHILGVLDLLQDVKNRFQIERIWFNGWRHLDPSHGAVLGPADGDRLSKLLDTDHHTVWNKPFSQSDPKELNNGAIVTHADDSPRRVSFAGLDIDIISPTPHRLRMFIDEWATATKRELDKPRKEPRESVPDNALGQPGFEKLLALKGGSDGSAANGSSIAFVLTADGKRVLFTGDAFKGVVAKGVKKLRKPGDDYLTVDLVKVSHHGSKNNTSKTLLKVVRSSKWLFCSNGKIHNHPDPQTVAWVIEHGRPDGVRPTVYFNYFNDLTNLFDKPAWKDKSIGHDYDTVYPYAGDNTRGVTVDV